MRFVTSKTTSHVFLVVPKNPTKKQTNSNFYHLTKPFNSVKMLCKPSRSFSNGRNFSVSDLGKLPRSDPVVIKRPALSALCYANVSRLQVLQQKSAQPSPRKSCSSGYGDIRRCSTAASVVTSSLGSLVFSPSSLVVKSQLTQSKAPQRLALRRDKLTACAFSTALGFWKGNRRNELWQEKVFAPDGAQPSLAKSCSSGFGNIRKCSTAASVVTSSLGSLVFRPPSSLVVKSHLTQSDAPQKSEEWFALRRDKLTTSTFSTALGFWKGNRRNELWQEKVFAPEGDSFSAAAKSAMNWGVLNETPAVERYKSITGREVSFLGFAVHADEKFEWLGASPDGLLGGCPGGGILEVKCPYNKGKPELGLPWSTVPFYYMPQVQGQMEVLDREWVDLYCWTPNGSTIFRVCRAREYWELINGILREFWWENVVPAKELMSLGREEDARNYKPTSTHKQTGLAIVKSIQLAAESKLLCKEIAGHIEFYS
ncbi:Restriction endonuclease, type II-like superfamily protein [Thalictrum thalictroides]|uniref:Restriction endonuclease, type II-like superfamily protein n=1 Tax=Thalictrum thalictroides TaxID=46969 RepID=A0A7J6WA05_THATH|nr:Restriction endonuclease, type II-like superfamily protein [Thalictrum thalictroides]